MVFAERYVGKWGRKMTEEPLVTCTYGWGRCARLYTNWLDADGIQHDLETLVDLQVQYQRFLGITSARLVVHFKTEIVVLRGVAEIAGAQTMEDYLRARLLELYPAPPLLLAAPIPAPPISDAIPQSQFWVYDADETAPNDNESPGEQIIAETLPAQEQLPVTPQETLEEPLQQGIQEHHHVRLRRLRSERIGRENGFDVQELALYLKTSALQPVEVPTALSSDETAYYRTEATLCGEPDGSIFAVRNRFKYRSKDQGILVLTDKRFLYIGRSHRISHRYKHLREVIRTRRFIRVVVDDQEHYQQFEVSRPLEVKMYLECILRRYVRPTPRHTRKHPSIALPTPSSTTTTPFHNQQTWHDQERSFH